jgi:hypothetical protein
MALPDTFDGVLYALTNDGVLSAEPARCWATTGLTYQQDARA